MNLGPLRTEPETTVIAKAQAAMSDTADAAAEARIIADQDAIFAEAATPDAQRADEPDPALAMLAQLAVRVTALEARLAVLSGSLGTARDSAPATITDAEPNAPR